ncbi:MAG: tRNA (adenosine(37)-N6)-threonylcarbamoyltransferase complex ATPase subunit type 1 TsaE [bacterium]
MKNIKQVKEEVEIVFSFDQLEVVVKEGFVPCLKTHAIFAFNGPLGAGKTTIIKEILKQCGVTEVVNSPTFGYVKSYKGSGGVTYNHFDLYRLDSLESFVHAGFDEFLCAPNTFNFIEWPEIISSLLESLALYEKVRKIDISYHNENIHKRVVKF